LTIDEQKLILSDLRILAWFANNLFEMGFGPSNTLVEAKSIKDAIRRLQKRSDFSTESSKKFRVGELPLTSRAANLFGVTYKTPKDKMVIEDPAQKERATIFEEQVKGAEPGKYYPGLKTLRDRFMRDVAKKTRDRILKTKRLITNTKLQTEIEDAVKDGTASSLEVDANFITRYPSLLDFLTWAKSTNRDRKIFFKNRSDIPTLERVLDKIRGDPDEKEMWKELFEVFFQTGMMGTVGDQVLGLGGPRKHRGILNNYKDLTTYGLASFNVAPRPKVQNEIDKIMDTLVKTVEDGDGNPKYWNLKTVAVRNEYDAWINPMNKMKRSMYISSKSSPYEAIPYIDSVQPWGSLNDYSMTIGETREYVKNSQTKGIGFRGFAFGHPALPDNSENSVQVLPPCYGFNINFSKVPILSDHPIEVWSELAMPLLFFDPSYYDDISFDKFINVLKQGKAYVNFPNFGDESFSSMNFGFDTNRKSVGYTDPKNPTMYFDSCIQILWSIVSSIRNSDQTNPKYVPRIRKFIDYCAKNQIPIRVGNDSTALHYSTRFKTDKFDSALCFCRISTRVRLFSQNQKFIKFNLLPKIQFYGSILKGVPSFKRVWADVRESLQNLSPEFAREIDIMIPTPEMFIGQFDKPVDVTIGEKIVDSFIRSKNFLPIRNEPYGSPHLDSSFNVLSNKSVPIYFLTTQLLGYSLVVPKSILGGTFQIKCRIPQVTSKLPRINLYTSMVEITNNLNLYVILNRALSGLFWVKKKRLQDIAKRRLDKFLKQDTRKINSVKYFLGQ
jgi:hypothetical protein